MLRTRGTRDCNELRLSTSSRQILPQSSAELGRRGSAGHPVPGSDQSAANEAFHTSVRVGHEKEGQIWALGAVSIVCAAHKDTLLLLLLTTA